MSDLIGIASNAVSAYQLALGTVSNNIANVSTDGYTRQSVELNSGTPRRIGTAYIGSGVVFDRVKRQFDAFAEANLRSSSSELASQEPVVSYTNRVIDLMGSETAGLGSSFDQFFGSARALTTDPASSVLRGQFLRDAEGVSSRFGQIAAQLDTVDTETREDVAASLGELNTLSTQLAAINQQMAKTASVSRQPPELVDQRDRLLRELSEIVRIRTSFAPNGAVTVALGGTVDRDVIVDNTRAIRVDYTFDAASPERIALVIDPYGAKPSPLTGISSGKLAGLLAFREQVLETTRDAMEFLADTFVREVNGLHRSGVDAYGQVGGDLFAINPQSRFKAGGLSLAIDDPMRIAAAAQFRVIENSTNTGLADATVRFEQPVHEQPPAVSSVLVNNPHPSAGKAFQLGNLPAIAPIATVPAGMRDVTLYLDEATGNQQLQVVTRDGRHLLGTVQDEPGKAVLLSQPGMVTGARYSDQYLGLSGANGYKDMTVFYGARADQRALPRFDDLGKPLPPTAAPAVMSGGRIKSGLTGLPPNSIKINGFNLPALTPPVPNSTVQANDIAKWINDWAATRVPSLGIAATASNEIRVPIASLKMEQSLYINDEPIVLSAAQPTPADLVDAINAASGDSYVKASLSAEGDLVLSNTAGKEGQSIRISPSKNILDLESITYGGRVEMSRSLSNAAGGTAIEVSFGVGKPSDLASLGFRPAAYLRGVVPDDVLAFVTDSSGSMARVSASYAGEPASLVTGLRAQPMEIEVISGAPAGLLRYRITDLNTQTVMAERDLDPALLDTSQPGGGIVFQGLMLSFSSPPRVGDRFLLDGNKDGTGNNDNIRALAAIESAKLVAGGKTLGAAYVDHVNNMGNIARQASIAQDALEVVRDQAVEARDKVSGVNLDEEAANLIRFQQAYQASAKVMQTAAQLFDTVLQVT